MSTPETAVGRGAPESAAKRQRGEKPRGPGPSLRVFSWNIDVATQGHKMTCVAADLAKALSLADVILLQELGPWDNPMTEDDWKAFKHSIFGNRASQ